MNANRELLKAEIKTTSFHRRMVKARAKTLFKNAQKNFDYIKESKDVNDFSKYYRSLDTASYLKDSKASYARSLNIASGLIKGIPYKSIEAKCHNSPSAKEVLEIIKAHSTFHQRLEWTLERVESLLA